jgi:hypothetical protein
MQTDLASGRREAPRHTAGCSTRGSSSPSGCWRRPICQSMPLPANAASAMRPTSASIFVVSLARHRTATGRRFAVSPRDGASALLKAVGGELGEPIAAARTVDLDGDATTARADDSQALSQPLRGSECFQAQDEYTESKALSAKGRCSARPCTTPECGPRRTKRRTCAREGSTPVIWRPLELRANAIEPSPAPTSRTRSPTSLVSIVW